LKGKKYNCHSKQDESLHSCSPSKIWLIRFEGSTQHGLNLELSSTEGIAVNQLGQKKIL
jgi:hypothetical protein